MFSCLRGDGNAGQLPALTMPPAYAPCFGVSASCPGVENIDIDIRTYQPNTIPLQRPTVNGLTSPSNGDVYPTPQLTAHITISAEPPPSRMTILLDVGLCRSSGYLAALLPFIQFVQSQVSFLFHLVQFRSHLFISHSGLGFSPTLFALLYLSVLGYRIVSVP